MCQQYYTKHGKRSSLLKLPSVYYWVKRGSSLSVEKIVPFFPLSLIAVAYMFKKKIGCFSFVEFFLP